LGGISGFEKGLSTPCGQGVLNRGSIVTCSEDRAELAKQRHDDDELTWHVQRDGSYSAMCRLTLEVAACGLAFR
jgi:hypothetical protein